MSGFFEVYFRDGSSRSGVLNTSHGSVNTPAFMPVATQGSVKAVAPDDLETLGASILLSNTYHLMLRPGIDLIHRQNNLHTFMNWQRPILTDSGGFQTFSLGRLTNMSDSGVIFRSHIDGREHFLSPELSIQYQGLLGSDIAMVLDECSPYGLGREELNSAMQRTHVWARRSRDAHDSIGQSLFAVVQGGVFPELRLASAETLVSMDFDGYAIGGLSVGEPKEAMYKIASLMGSTLPEHKPRYLMGVGSPEDLVECVAQGMDLFDCSLPTRVARNGGLFTYQGRVNITNASFREADGPFDLTCDCYCCTNFSASYIHHLFKAKELLAYRLASIHNLRFVMRLMDTMRQAIKDGKLREFRDKFWSSYKPSDERTRLLQRDRWLQRIH